MLPRLPIELIEYKDLQFDMYFQTKSGCRINQVIAVASDRILYKSLLTNYVGTLHKLRCVERRFINLNHLFNEITNKDLPF